MTATLQFPPSQPNLSGLLFAVLLQVRVVDFIWPEDPEDSSQAALGKGLKFVDDVVSDPPGLGSIGIEDAHLGGWGVEGAKQ